MTTVNEKKSVYMPLQIFICSITILQKEGSGYQGGYSTNEVRWSMCVPRHTFIVVVFHWWVYSDVLPGDGKYCRK